MWTVGGERLFPGFCLEQAGKKGSTQVDQFGVKGDRGMCLLSSGGKRSSEMSHHGRGGGALELGLPVLLL